MLFYIILLVLCGTSLACPDAKPAKNSNLALYARGKWYEIARYNNYDLEKNAECITYTFTPSTSRTHNVTIREVKDKKVKVIENQMYETDDVGKVIFHSDTSGTANLTAFVLATDNTNYFLFYNCVVENKQTKEYSWIVSKTPTIIPELKAVIHKYIDETHILDSSKFVWDNYKQGDCVSMKS